MYDYKANKSREQLNAILSYDGFMEQFNAAWNINTGTESDNPNLKDCLIQGTVTLAEGAQMVSCVVSEGVTVVLGKNTKAYNCAFNAPAVIGNDSLLYDVTVKTGAKLHLGDSSRVKIMTVEDFIDVCAGDRAMLHNVIINAQGYSARRIKLGNDACIGNANIRIDVNTTVGDAYTMVDSPRSCTLSIAQIGGRAANMQATIGDNVVMACSIDLYASKRINIGSRTRVQGASCSDSDAFSACIIGSSIDIGYDTNIIVQKHNSRHLYDARKLVCNSGGIKRIGAVRYSACSNICLTTMQYVTDCDTVVEQHGTLVL